jgi:hypothetical protein
MAVSVRVPGFLPSTCGLHFVNYTLPRIRYDPSESVATIIARIKAAGG